MIKSVFKFIVDALFDPDDKDPWSRIVHTRSKPDTPRPSPHK